MRVLHTADWHLGQSLHGVSRSHEHEAFFLWLTQQISGHQIDALVVTGDIFDVSTPSAEAQAQYYGFLANIRQKYPKLTIVLIGGNHDAPARLDAARSILDALRIHMVGGMPLRGDGTWDMDRLLIRLSPSHAESPVWVIAVPFLRPKDLPRTLAEAEHRAGLSATSPPDDSSRVESHQDLFIQKGYRYVYQALTQAAEHICPPNTLLCALGHAYVSGGQLSELSERKIQQGNQQALAVSETFPTQLRYVGLGHLHLAQNLSQTPPVWYPGSPIPLSMGEINYPHQILVIDIRDDGTNTTSVRIPRSRQLMRVPTQHAPLNVVIEQLSKLPRQTDASTTLPPLLEVRVLLKSVEPQLRQKIEEALLDAHAQLLRIDILRPEEPTSSGLEHLNDNLSNLQPEDVFMALHQRVENSDPSTELLNAFRELLEQVETPS